MCLSLSLCIHIRLYSHLFWVGDLNYRLNLNEDDVVFDRIAKKDWPFLLAYDQASRGQWQRQTQTEGRTDRETDTDRHRN